jgi:hypothetical protein
MMSLSDSNLTPVVLEKKTRDETRRQRPALNNQVLRQAGGEGRISTPNYSATPEDSSDPIALTRRCNKFSLLQTRLRYST